MNILTKINFRELTGLVVLVIVVCAAYSNTLDSSFHLDDERAIGDNPPVFMRDITLDNLSRAAFESKIRTRPVAHLTFALNYYFHHLDVRGYHIVNIVIHIIASLALFYLLKATLSLPLLIKNYNEKDVFIISLLTTAIWALHPLQTQSVTYIVQRMNSMASMFYIISLLFYVKGKLASVNRTKWLLFTGCIISGLLALGSKENAATLPVFIFLYEWFFLQDLRLKLLLNKRQWFLVAAALAVMGTFAVIFYGAKPIKNILAPYELVGFTLTQKLLTEARVIILYISRIFFPHPEQLNLDYDFSLSNSLVDPAATFFSVILLAGLFLAAVLLAKKQRLFSFCIFWFLGNLFIESSFPFLELVFEHRTYLPSTFFLLLIVIPLYRLLCSKKYVLYTAVLIPLVVLPYWTYERNKVWTDELTLWQDCLEKSPDKWRVHNNLGKEFFRRWETDKAIYHYQRALQIAPNAILPRMNLATALAMSKRYQEAIIQLEIVLNKEPNNEKARNHLQSNRIFLQQQQMQRR